MKCKWMILCWIGVTACSSRSRAPSDYAPSAPSPSMAAAEAPPAPPAQAQNAPASRSREAKKSRGFEASFDGSPAAEAGDEARVGGHNAKGGPGGGGAAKHGKREQDNDKSQANAPVQSATRMVHYSASLKLKVVSSAETLAKAAKLNEEMGGYVENLSETQITLRVPVAKFRDLFAALLNLGEVLERSINAEDVTDAFTAMDLRAGILRASRDRLVTLLAKATTARQKLEILSEINRLTEEVDQLEQAMNAYTALATYSRVTLDAVAKTLQLHTADNEPIAAFRWIHSLSPSSREAATAANRLELSPPSGMIEVKRGDFWTAESADGAIIWASERNNVPRGSTEFWLEALRTRLAPQYTLSDVSSVGAYRLLRLVDDKNETAYRYLIAVRADGDKLRVVEIYFASAAQEKRYAGAVQAAITKG